MTPTAELRRLFGDRLQEAVSLARLTSSRIGGTAEALIEVRDAGELRQAAVGLWGLRIPFRMLGGGSNILVSDAGVREVIVANQAAGSRFDVNGLSAHAWAESGASLGGLARRAGDRGLSGLEWAATVPGTVGGAVVGNAGAHGGDVARSLMTAEILQPPDRVENWKVERLEYGYRSSWLKQHPGEAVVLSAVFGLELSSPEVTRARMEANIAHRRQTQPPGASWGSMFKNPPGDFAGRLIEAAGLKGWRIGQVEVSPVHANFFLNHGGATAADVASLLIEVRRRVRESSGVELELEIELLGDWPTEVREALA
ncbi:MAG TPA: UDP-N-acetylmuramate dehydrogenase [Anaerolineales bacterium]|nr:UDP-N-acetylmuramate dehydrogenase [Anaerolineales bacterium]